MNIASPCPLPVLSTKHGNSWEYDLPGVTVVGEAGHASKPDMSPKPLRDIYKQQSGVRIAGGAFAIPYERAAIIAPDTNLMEFGRPRIFHCCGPSRQLFSSDRIQQAASPVGSQIAADLSRAPDRTSCPSIVNAALYRASLPNGLAARDFVRRGGHRMPAVAAGSTRPNSNLSGSARTS